MKFKKLLPMVIFTMLLAVVACKPKDADLKMAVEKAISAMSNTSGITVDVKDGVVSLGGECKDEMLKTSIGEVASAIKGVKSVTNNCTVTPEVVAPAPVEITADDPLLGGVNDAIKDFAGVSATVSEGVITLTGEITKKDLGKLMPSLMSLKPKKVDNKLTVK